MKNKLTPDQLYELVKFLDEGRERVEPTLYLWLHSNTDWDMTREEDQQIEKLLTELLEGRK